jgi:hypothetical protein
MRNIATLTWLGCVLALAGMSCATAATVEVPVEFTLTSASNFGFKPPPEPTYNELNLTVKLIDWGLSDTQVTTASGSFAAVLYTGFNSSWNAQVNGLGFVQRPYVPGDLSFTDMLFFNYLGGIVVTKSLMGDLNTASPPRPVNPDGTYLNDGHALLLNGGTLVDGSTGNNFELAEKPLELNLSGSTGSITVSSPTIIGNQAFYDVTLLLPVVFHDWSIEGMDGVTFSAEGTIRATGTFSQTIPEPSTLVLLAAALAGLLGYAWRKRK